MNPPSRIVALLSREPFVVSALLTLAALYAWHLLTITEVILLPSVVGPQAIETIAEVWLISALPALWLASRWNAAALTVFAAALVPPAIVHLAIFTLGSIIPTDEESTRNLQIVQFILGTTALVGCIAASTLLFLRSAKNSRESTTNAA